MQFTWCTQRANSHNSGSSVLAHSHTVQLRQGDRDRLIRCGVANPIQYYFDVFCCLFRSLSHRHRYFHCDFDATNQQLWPNRSVRNRRKKRTCRLHSYPRCVKCNHNSADWNGVHSDSSVLCSMKNCNFEMNHFGVWCFRILCLGLCLAKQQNNK